jgi:hypothetical protein
MPSAMRERRYVCVFYSWFSPVHVLIRSAIQNTLPISCSSSNHFFQLVSRRPVYKVLKVSLSILEMSSYTITYGDFYRDVIMMLQAIDVKSEKLNPIHDLHDEQHRSEMSCCLLHVSICSQLLLLLQCHIIQPMKIYEYADFVSCCFYWELPVSDDNMRCGLRMAYYADHNTVYVCDFAIFPHRDN